MTKRSTIVVALCLLILAGAWIVGQTQSKPASGKLAVVHPEVVLQNTDEGKAEIARLQQLGQQKQTQLNTQAEELRKLEADYQQLPGTTTPQVRAQKEREIQDRQVKLRRLQEDVQAEVGQHQEIIMGRMAEKLQNVLNEYAQANNFDMIFRLDQQGFAYVNPTLDVTMDVAKLYNQKHPGTGAAQPATPPATQPAAPAAPRPQP